jgi:Domain of unknown function DUF29
MSSLYDDEVLLCSERQAALQRRMAGEGVNVQVGWENVAEEIEDVGCSSLRACWSELLHALLHDLKAKAWPLSRDAPTGIPRRGWRG